MPIIEYDILIRRPIEVVFAFVNDFTAYPRWQQGVVRARVVSAGPLAVGSCIIETRRFIGREIETAWEVTEFEPPTRRSFRITEGPALSTGTMTFIPVVEGTRLNLRVNMKGRGVFKLLEPLLVRLIRASQPADFMRLKQLLESQES